MKATRKTFCFSEAKHLQLASPYESFSIFPNPVKFDNFHYSVILDLKNKGFSMIFVGRGQNGENDWPALYYDEEEQCYGIQLNSKEQYVHTIFISRAFDHVVQRFLDDILYLTAMSAKDLNTSFEEFDNVFSVNANSG